MSTNRSSLSSTQSGGSSTSNYPHSFRSNEKLISESNRNMQYQLHRELLNFPGGIAKYRPYLRKRMWIRVAAMILATFTTVAVVVPLMFIFEIYYLAFIPGLALILASLVIFKTVHTYRKAMSQLDTIIQQINSTETSPPIVKVVEEKEVFIEKNLNRSSIPPPPLRPPPALTNYDFPTMNGDLENRASMIQWVKIESFKIDMPKIAEPAQQ